MLAATSPPKRGRPPLIGPLVLAAIEGGRNAARRPEEIKADLEKFAMFHPELGLKIPSIRSIQRHMGPRPEPQWSLANSSVEGSRVILNLLAELITSTNGTVDHLTVKESEWLIRIDRAVPSLEAALKWRLARAFVVREQRQLPFNDLEHLLAFQPWLDEEHRSRYESAVKNGWIAKEPQFPTEIVWSDSLQGFTTAAKPRGFENAEWLDLMITGLRRFKDQQEADDDPQG